VRSISRVVMISLVLSAACASEHIASPAPTPVPAASLSPIVSGNATPLFVIDGVKLGHLSQDSLNTRINALGGPNAIQEIEVVKGPSAATLYGADAVSGIILITTKAGAAKR
jgi:TonB-dependent SusC/RagA subfamily outer membrane receptor